METLHTSAPKVKVPKSTDHLPSTEPCSIVEKLMRKLRDCISNVLYSLETLWLFTVSDLKTFVVPEAVFGLSSALAGPAVTTHPDPRVSAILGRAVHTIAWTWLNTFIFNLANQRLPSSIVEDKLNKPFRPLAAGRITKDQTRHVLMVGIPLVVTATLFLGATEETLILIALTWMYNDLGGADENFLVRNLINGFAHPAYSAGATRVACGDTKCTLNKYGYTWIAMIGAVIFSTLQIQDLKDQAGDRARGRATAPLTLGDMPSRWTVAIPVVLWSVVCPTYWGSSVWGYTMPVVLGGLVVGRLFLRRDMTADKHTWQLWSVWMISLYLTPFFGERGTSWGVSKG